MRAMVGAMSVLALTTAGCGFIVAPGPPRVRDLEVAVSPWTAERGGWYFAHCALVRADVSDAWSAWTVGANHALLVGDNALAFRCATRPPFDLERLPPWRARAELAEKNGFRCDAPKGVGASEIEVLSSGNGAAIGEDTFVRARQRVVAIAAPRTARYHHGRLVEPTSPTFAAARAVEKGEMVTVVEEPVEWTRHTSCWDTCTVEAWRGLGLGAKVRYRCGNVVEEIEPVEQGGVALFRDRLP